MGKSGGRKKKGVGVGVGQNLQQNQVSLGDDNHTRIDNGGIDFSSSVFLKRAHELKEEGNKKFQAKDYAGALQHYDNALKLLPKMHADRAVFHSNRAACLMQMKPIDYDAVISECTLALQVQPGFVRALLRRARAFEAIGKNELAALDAQLFLNADPNHNDGLELAGRLKMALGPRQEAQQDLPSRPSPAALGASAVRGAPVGGHGPCLPARPVSKKTGSAPAGSVLAATNKPERSYQALASENSHKAKTKLPNVSLKPSNGPSILNNNLIMGNNAKEPRSSYSATNPARDTASGVAIQWRPLKLVYDHDIRLAQMPVNSTFKYLREMVGKKFPMAKSVLIKYKDNDGDLITVTCTGELHLAESLVDKSNSKVTDEGKVEALGMLRLHIVEVSPEQEPPLLEEEEKEKPLKNNAAIDNPDVEVGDSIIEGVDIEEMNKSEKVEKEKTGASDDTECKEVEMDDWLFEFAQLFRTHVGIDPDAHIDLHELGMELCSEALEESVTSEEAQALFDKAALKFQEVAALAFFNWGNVHMCAARKRIPIENSASDELMASQIQTAYDWVKEKYTLAKQRYEEALSVKPDFYEGLLALGQQQFEMAKLHWSFVLARKEDLSKWDPSETLQLFDSAQEKMKAATDMWEKLEKERANEVKDPCASKSEDLVKRRKKQGNGTENEISAKGGQEKLSAAELTEQAAVMRSQIHLFWGNMLFERSQLEFKLGLTGWKKNLDTAVERFKLAGASENDIGTVLKNHSSNEETSVAQGPKIVDLSAGAVEEKNVTSEISE